MSERATSVRIEGNADRLELGRTHVHGDAAIVEALGFDRSCRAFEQEALLGALLVGQHPNDTAHAVATLRNFRAIGIEYAVARIHGRVAGRANPHQLVEAGSGCLVAKLPQLFRRRRWPVLRAFVDDDDAIAGTVHFQESKLHGQSLTVGNKVDSGSRKCLMDF